VRAGSIKSPTAQAAAEGLETVTLEPATAKPAEAARAIALANLSLAAFQLPSKAQAAHEVRVAWRSR